MTCNVQLRTRIVMQACVVCCIVFLLAGFCFGQPSISLSPASGPPTTSLRVSGSGFAPYAKIDIYFDTQDGALVVADRTGSFSQIAVAAPASALPGEHWVSAVQRSGQAGAQTPFLVHTHWGQFHRYNMRRWNWTENVIGVNNVAKLQLKWSYNIGASNSSPAVEDGVVYAGSWSGLLYAFNTSTGALLWSYQTASNGQNDTSPAVNNKKVFFGSIDGLVYALDARTGAKLWSYQTGGAILSSPSVIDGVVYIGSNDGNLYVLNADTGALLWKYSTGGEVSGSPAVANGTVYFESEDGNVYALNASTGAKLWSYYVGGNYFLWTSSPVVANGLVYVGAGDTFNFYALNASTGSLVWSQFIGTGNVETSSPAIAHGVVYIGSGNGNLYALNDETGAILWTYDTGNSVNNSPAVANGLVYFGTNNWVFYAADAATGAVLWSYPTDYSEGSSPAVADGLVFVDDNGGNFYCFSLPPNQAEAAASAKAPVLKTLQPDFTLKVSGPTAPAAVDAEE